MLDVAALGVSVLAASTLRRAFVQRRGVLNMAAALRERLQQSDVAVQGLTLAATGHADGWPVVVEHICTDGGGVANATRIAVRLPDPLSELSMWPIGHPKTWLLSGRIETGDPVFDDEVHVVGSPALTAAVLTEGARARLVGLVKSRHGFVHGGWIEIRHESVLWDRERLDDDLELLIRVARTIEMAPDGLGPRLALVAAQDGLQEVRRIAFAELERRFPALAAQQSPPAEDAPARTAAEAHRRLRDSELEPLERARLWGLVAREDRYTTGTPELICMLRSSDAEVQLAAIDALSEIDRADAAAELHDLAHRLFTSKTARAAARRALSRRRERLGSSHAGALSLCPSDETGAAPRG